MGIIFEYLPQLARGALVTLELAFVGWFFGTVLGVIVAFISRRSHYAYAVVRCFGYGLSATPFLVTLVWMHYPLQGALQIVVPAFWTASIALVLYNTVAVAHVVDSALERFPGELHGTALSCGLSEAVIRRRILFPLVVRSILPGLLSQQVQILHLTMFASLISVDELFREVQRIVTREFNPVLLYSALAVFYTFFSLPLVLIAKAFRVKWDAELTGAIRD